MNTEIKKALNGVTANRLSTAGGFVWYEAKVGDRKVTFKVPEIEAVNFGQTEPAKLLIRWIND